MPVPFSRRHLLQLLQLLNDSAAVWTSQERISECLNRLSSVRSNSAPGGAPQQGHSSGEHRGGLPPTQGSRQGSFAQGRLLPATSSGRNVFAAAAAAAAAGGGAGLPSQGSGRGAFYQPHFSQAGGAAAAAAAAARISPLSSQGSGRGTIWDRQLQRQASRASDEGGPAVTARRKSFDSPNLARVSAELANLGIGGGAASPHSGTGTPKSAASPPERQHAR